MARPVTTDFSTLAWQGEAPLWRMFWIYTCIVAVVAWLLLMLIPAGAVRWTIGVILLVPYFGWAAICLWRCAPNSRWAVWGYSTRILMVVGLVLFLARYIGRSTFLH